MPSYIDDEMLRESVLLFSELMKTYGFYRNCTGDWISRTRNATIIDLERFEKQDKAGLAKIMKPELNKIRKELGLAELVEFPAK